MNEEEQKKQFALSIADVIQQLLRESDELAEILEYVREEGYDVFLSIFSGIVIKRHNEKRSDEADDEGAQELDPLPLTFQFTEADKVFLKSIGIQAPEE
jgi:hypothetical protein